MRSPLRFRPYLRPMVWGGRQLGQTLGKSLPTGEGYGESWEVSDHPTHRSVAADGSTLRGLMESAAKALLGADREQFPWLVKYLDARDWLSVQVHPDEGAVQWLLPGENSKTEAWFILAAEPGSRVYAGLRPGVDEARLRRAVEDGTVARCLHSFEPRAGQCVFLPAGTVHAVGGGVLIAEVQQTSDATFRLFDWNRLGPGGEMRPLHLEEAIASIHWTAGPVEPVRVEGYPDGGPSWQELVRCRFFHLDYVRQREAFCLPAGRMQVVMVLHGEGELLGEGGRERLVAGDTLLLPATMPVARVLPRGGLGLLLASLPEAAEGRRAA
ncbi:MAG: type I phosphomannose isomerase catalytic subunit [Gemmataceae bacterium]